MKMEGLNKENNILETIFKNSSNIVIMSKEELAYKNFKQKYLVEDYRNSKGEPVHTRYYKKMFYKYAKQLKEEFNFDMYTCSECNCTEHNGRPIMMELDHLNRKTNDARIENLSMKCPNCHSQTDGYKNRKVSIEELHQSLKKSQI
jgi:Zn finger protein HypA/HybF involved in hydrogenase expression